MTVDFFSTLGIDSESFFEDIWQKKHAAFQGVPADLPNIIELNHLLTNVRISSNKVRLVRADKEASNRDFTRQDGFINLVNVTSLLSEGYSLVISGIHNFSRKINDHCRTLSVGLGASVQANLYFSPKRSQGFKAHWDKHDVLVYQTEGEKKWAVYNEPHFEFPTQSTPCDPSVLDLNRAYSDITMQPGTVLYIPRGFTHFATTHELPSIHITFAIEYPK
ncbi:MAG: hypothetical protein EOP04_14920, partial [Proteobacteria bacterium]